MNGLNRYCRSIQRKTKRLLKWFFGYPDFKSTFEAQKYLKSQVEEISGKNIEDVTIQDLNGYEFGCYCYAKLRTLKKITDIYLDITSLVFYSDELEEYYGH